MTPQDERIKELEAKLMTDLDFKDGERFDATTEHQYQKKIVELEAKLAKEVAFGEKILHAHNEVTKEYNQLLPKLTEAQRVIKDFREALECSDCYCEESLPVNDFLKSSTCHYCEALSKHPAPSEEKAE